MRTLDNDPYIDAMWSIITGIDAEYALKSIDNESIPQPFIIQNAIAFTNLEPNLFEKCFNFSDAKEGAWFAKNSPLEDENSEEQDQGDHYPRAPALIFYQKLEEIEPDLIVTSGHGYEDSVEMPWSMGKLKVSEHGFIPMDHDDQPVAPVIESSPHPKIYLPIANCLVGHCNGPYCMVTTFMGRMGVRQMCGYTVRTWYGRAGWGTLDLWKSVPGRLSLADAFFLTQARMIYEVKVINPRLLNFKFDVSSDDPGYEEVVEQVDKQFHLDEKRMDGKVIERVHGHSYDRDTFVFYGDPAFIAKLDEEKNEKLLTTKFLRTGRNTHQFVVEFKDAETAQNFSLPVGSMFTTRIENFNIINGFEYEPIISDNFLILMKPKPNDPEVTRIQIDFRGTMLRWANFVHRLIVFLFIHGWGWARQSAFHPINQFCLSTFTSKLLLIVVFEELHEKSILRQPDLGQAERKHSLTSDLSFRSSWDSSTSSSSTRMSTSLHPTLSTENRTEDLDVQSRSRSSDTIEHLEDRTNCQWTRRMSTDQTYKQSRIFSWFDLIEKEKEKNRILI